MVMRKSMFRRYNKYKKYSSMLAQFTKKPISTRIPRTIRSATRGVHSFKRTYTSQYALYTNSGMYHYANNNTAPVQAGYFTLNALPNVSEFTSLFDQYKINAVKLKWLYSRNSSSSNGTTTSEIPIPILYTVQDRDDDNTLTSLNDYMEYDTMKYNRLDKPVGRYVKPNYARMVYNGQLTTAYGSGRGMWLDCANTTIPHYAIKVGIDTLMPNTIDPKILYGTVQLICTYYFQCRDQR